MQKGEAGEVLVATEGSLAVAKHLRVRQCFLGL